jgi:hypothetical protein
MKGETSMRDLQTYEVELSVGLVLKMSQSNWRISRKKEKLQLDAQENPLEDPDDQLFAVNFYPVLAAAVVSNNCPTLEECLEVIPEDDLEAWYATAKKANPSWFIYMDAIAELMRQRESSDTETKKEQSLSLTEEESPLEE